MTIKDKVPSEILIAIAKILDELKIPYYVTGGFAVSIWGRPRFTADIDLIIKMSHSIKNQFSRKIKEIFPKGYIDIDQIDTALARNGEFNFIDPDTGMKIDFWVSKKDEFEEECFRNIKVKNLGYKVNFISPENLILSKLIWYGQTNSSRHLEDAQTVRKITKIDQNYLNIWAEKLALTSYLEKI